MAAGAPPRVVPLAPALIAAQAEALADVLIDCVEGGASVGFLAPLPRERAIAFFHGVAEAVARGERVLLAALDEEGRVVGTAQLLLAMPDNQPHRGEVAKLLVHRAARRRGVAHALMAALDDEAHRAGRTLLVLDTATGSDAERLYPALGWRRVGEIPGYALLPDGAPCGTTLFWKPIA